MSAEYDIHAQTESEDGGVPLAKVESDEMDMGAGSDTTPTSQDSGESSSPSSNAWGETSPFLGEVTELGHQTVEHQHAPAFLWANNFLLSDGIQPPDEELPHIWSAPSDVVPISTNPLPSVSDVIPTELSEPPMVTSEDETPQDASESHLEAHPISAGVDHTDGPDEVLLALSEDSYNILNSDIAPVNDTLQTLNQASNFSYYDQDDLEDNTIFFSVSYFLYYWKQAYSNHKSDYPPISQLANDRTKVRRPDKITAYDREQYNYQGIYWSRYQTTEEEAREVRRMTYRNLRNLGPPDEEKFGTKAFKANFPGKVIPGSDCYFHFNEMDMKRNPDYSHPQLRHNLSATSKNAIFYTNRPPRHNGVSAWDTYSSQYKTIVSFNPETGTEECAMDIRKRYNWDDPKLSRIHTLTAGNGVLVAGSFDGVYAMKSLSADFESAPVVGTIATGGDVSTNHVHTHLDRQSGLPRVVFDSNDMSVRILDCTATKWVACHKYPYQVNCSVTSSDGRLRLLNGDNCEPIVANADTGETLARLPGHNDFGFACDWAPDGITMATGHQDGLVKVWDARKLNQSIQTIAMEQAGCRSLQFSPLGSGKRVLVLAEPADFVHVVDAQTFESKQTIDFFGDISGISMPPDGSKLYIANADAKYGGLMEFDRSWDSSGYNRRPFRAPDLEDEHEEMVDCIVDGVQPAQWPPKLRDKLYQHAQKFMHARGQSRIKKSVIDCARLFFRCLNMGGGQRVTASGEWSTIARTFDILCEEDVSFGQQLYECWQDNLAASETSLPFVQMLQEWQRATGREISGRVGMQKGCGKAALDEGICMQIGEERQYRRDDEDPRRKDFKIGRKSETLDWLSESDIEDDARVMSPKGQHRGRYWGVEARGRGMMLF